MYCLVCRKEDTTKKVLCTTCKRQHILAYRMAKEFREIGQWGRLRYVLAEKGHEDLYLPIPPLSRDDDLYKRFEKHQYSKWVELYSMVDGENTYTTKSHRFLDGIMKLLRKGYNILLVDPEHNERDTRLLYRRKFEKLVVEKQKHPGKYSLMFCIASILYNQRYGIPTFWMDSTQLFFMLFQ